jgi:hypothetical protein
MADKVAALRVGGGARRSSHLPLSEATVSTIFQPPTPTSSTAGSVSAAPTSTGSGSGVHAVPAMAGGGGKFGAAGSGGAAGGATAGSTSFSQTAAAAAAPAVESPGRAGSTSPLFGSPLNPDATQLPSWLLKVVSYLQEKVRRIVSAAACGALGVISRQRLTVAAAVAGAC